MRTAWRAVASLLLWAVAAASAHAKIPDAYQPLVVEAPFSFSERVFDLTGAVERARSEGKPLYIYFGAADCPPCKAYSLFLRDNQAQLAASFDKVIVVDIRTWLKGPKLVFKVFDKRYTPAEFKALVGDANKEFVYPYYWLLTPELRQVKQLPSGTQHFMSIDKQREVLRLD